MMGISFVRKKTMHDDDDDVVNQNVLVQPEVVRMLARFGWLMECLQDIWHMLYMNYLQT